MRPGEINSEGLSSFSERFTRSTVVKDTRFVCYSVFVNMSHNMGGRHSINAGLLEAKADCTNRFRRCPLLVGDILAKKGSKIVTVAPDDSIADAVRTIIENSVGSALVLDSAGDIAGMVTERDVLRFSAGIGGSLAESKVSAIMSTDLIVALVDDDVETMIATMVENRFRHLPVLDEGKLVGLVSMGDLVKSQLQKEKGENRHLKDFIAGKYPA